MLDSKVILPIVGKSLVESLIFFLVDIFWFLHPDWLGLVEFFEFSGDFFNFLLLFVLLFFRDLNSLFLLLLFIFIIRDFLFVGFFNE